MTADGAHEGIRQAAEPKAAARLRLFGNVEIAGREGCDSLTTQPKRLALLLYLTAAEPLGFHRRDRLIELFWPEHTQDHARAALRKAIHAVRQAVGADAVISRGDEELAVNRQAVSCDAVEFADALANDRLARALELYHGEFLDGFFADAAGFERWAEGARTAYRAQAATAAWALAERYESGSDLTSASRWARRAATLAPTDERTLRRVLLLLDRAGDRAGVVGVYEEFTRRLARQYDIEPSAETQALVRRLRGH
jgi:DNA-binding SARP family transcriptional activator